MRWAEAMIHAPTTVPITSTTEDSTVLPITIKTKPKKSSHKGKALRWYLRKPGNNESKANSMASAMRENSITGSESMLIKENPTKMGKAAQCKAQSTELQKPSKSNDFDLKNAFILKCNNVANIKMCTQLTSIVRVL
jgi:hypothetical protein